MFPVLRYEHQCEHVTHPASPHVVVADVLVVQVLVVRIVEVVGVLVANEVELVALRGRDFHL